jgi:hypothetical protein
MKEKVILIQNPRAAVRVMIPRAQQLRRSVKENFPLACVGPDGSKKSEPAKIESAGGYRWIKVDKALNTPFSGGRIMTLYIMQARSQKDVVQPSAGTAPINTGFQPGEQSRLPLGAKIHHAFPDRAGSLRGETGRWKPKTGQDPFCHRMTVVDGGCHLNTLFRGVKL